jgi:receptor protein-tyrosine kinase
MAHTRDSNVRTTERSLIERAAERINTGQPASNAPRPATKTGVNGAAADRTQGQTGRKPQTSAAPIDFKTLKAQGFITPDTMRSRLAEQMRLIKRSVLHDFWSRKAERSNMIMVTSAAPGEGKSFIALNLALSLACELDLYVLLVDADFERPTALHSLGIETSVGLLDALAEPARDLGDIIQRTQIERLSVIGPGRNRELSAELLSSQRMREVADELASRYPDRLIIFDSSPLLAASEPVVMAELMGQVLFVVESDRTERGAVEESLDLLPEGCDPALVLNKGRSRSGSGELYYHDQYRRRR